MTAAYRYQRPAPVPHSIAAPAPVSSEVAGRVYLVRLACGDGVALPLSMTDFARLLNGRTGRHYDRGTIARLEIGRQAARLVDIECIAAVDPLKRGRSWLAFGESAERWVVR